MSILGINARSLTQFLVQQQKEAKVKVVSTTSGFAQEQRIVSAAKGFVGNFLGIVSIPASAACGLMVPLEGGGQEQGEDAGADAIHPPDSYPDTQPDTQPDHGIDIKPDAKDAKLDTEPPKETYPDTDSGIDALADTDAPIDTPQDTVCVNKDICTVLVDADSVDALDGKDGGDEGVVIVPPPFDTLDTHDAYNGDGETYLDADGEIQVDAPPPEEETQVNPAFCDNFPTAPDLTDDSTYPAIEAVDVPTGSLLITWPPSQDKDSGDVISYIFQLSSDPGFNNLTIDEAGQEGNQYQVIDGILEKGKTYYWRVIAEDACSQKSGVSETGFFTTEKPLVGPCDNPPSSFELVDPVVGETKVSNMTPIVWGDAIDTDPNDSVIYHLEVAEDEGFSNIVIDDTTTESGYNLADKGIKLKDGATYYWRVYAYDSCGVSNIVEMTPSTGYFTTAGPCDNDPGTFNLLKPDDKEKVDTFTPTLKWEPSNTVNDPNDSIKYDLFIDEDPGFGSPIIIPNLTTNSYQVKEEDGLEYGVQYFWKVTAKDTCLPEAKQTYNDGGARTFTIEPACAPHSLTFSLKADFKAGIAENLDLTTLPGELRLKRTWTEFWNAENGMPSWPLTINTFGGGPGTTTMTTIDEEPCVLISSILDGAPGGINDAYYYHINPGFHLIDGVVKGVAFFRAKLLEVDSASFDISQEATMTVYNGSIADVTLKPTGTMDSYAPSVSSYSMPSPDSPMDNLHSFRLEMDGMTHRLYINEKGKPVVTWTSETTTTYSLIYIGDLAFFADSRMCVSQIAYYNEGDIAPFISPGTYAHIVDMGSTPNNLGYGAILTSTELAPIGTSILTETKSCDNPLSEGTCSKFVPLGEGGLIDSPQKKHLVIKKTLSTSDTAATPSVEQFSVNWCTY